MKALILTILLLVNACGLWVCAADAACFVNDNQPWYVDIDRFMIVNKALELSDVGGIATMKGDIESGAAFFIDQGTRVEILETHPSGVCMIKAKGVTLFGFRHFITCD